MIKLGVVVHDQPHLGLCKHPQGCSHYTEIIIHFSECVPCVLYFNIGKASETHPKLIKLFNGFILQA